MTTTFDRRQVLKGIAYATATAAVGTSVRAAAPAGLAPAMTINHINIGVKEMKRTTDFYGAVVGAGIQAEIPKIVTTTYFPGSMPGKRGMWASIGASGGEPRTGSDGWDGTPGVITHIGYGVTIPVTDFPKIAEEVTKHFPNHKKPNLFKSEAAGQECMMFDPDGASFQLIPVEHDGTLKGYSTETGLKLTGAEGPQDKSIGQGKSTAVAPAMTINHIALDVKDLKKSTEYYSMVLGATPKQLSKNSQSLILPGSSGTYGSWISLKQVEPGQKTGYNHVSFGVAPDSDFKKISEALAAHMADKKAPSVFKVQDKWPGITFKDPDGISLQVFQIAYNGDL